MADPLRNLRRKWHLTIGTAMRCFEAVRNHIPQSAHGAAGKALPKEAALAAKGLLPVKVQHKTVLYQRSAS